jgi:hypothetical protein
MSHLPFLKIYAASHQVFLPSGSPIRKSRRPVKPVAQIGSRVILHIRSNQRYFPRLLRRGF